MYCVVRENFQYVCKFVLVQMSTAVGFVDFKKLHQELRNLKRLSITLWLLLKVKNMYGFVALLV